MRSLRTSSLHLGSPSCKYTCTAFTAATKYSKNMYIFWKVESGNYWKVEMGYNDYLIIALFI